MSDSLQFKPRVLHVTTTAMSLGWLLEPQLRAFACAGFDVVTASGPGPMVKRLEAAGIAHVPIRSFGRSVDVGADIRAARELRHVFKALRPDIVHTHNPKPGIIGRVLGRAQRVPVVVNTVHGLYAQETDSLKRRLPVYTAERFAASFSDAELVQSIEDVDTLVRLGVPRDRVHLLGNGIDLERFTPSLQGLAQSVALRQQFGIGSQVPVVGVIGRLVWEKGYREFFDAIKQLKSSVGTPFEVVVVGPTEPNKRDGVGDEDISRMSSLGVHFLGSRNDVDVLLQMFDLFVLPSHREGFPRAAMEACAMGLPVITTNIRGCRQVVRHEHNGLLYEPGESTQLAESIRRLVDDRLLRRRLGAAGAERAHVDFDQQRVIERTLAVYRTLLSERGIAQPWSEPATRNRYESSIDLVALAALNRWADSRASAASR